MHHRTARWFGTVLAGCALLLVSMSCSASIDDPSGTPGRLVPMLFLQANHPDGAQRTAVPLFEVLPDDSVQVIGTQGDVVVDGLQPIPDGGLAIVDSGSDDASTDVVVMGDDGEIQRRVDISMTGFGTGVLSAPSDTLVILQRVRMGTGEGSGGPVDVTMRSLTSGSEELLATLDRPIYAGDAAVGRLVLAGGGPSFSQSEILPCWVDLVPTGDKQLGTPEDGRESIELPDCDLVTDLKISPDARFAAVSFQVLDTEEMRVSIVRLTDLAVVETEEVGLQVGRCNSCQFSAMGGYLGMAWADGRTLRVARMTDLPLTMGQDRIEQVLERHLDVKEITVPGE